MAGLFFDSGIGPGFFKDLDRMNKRYNAFSGNVQKQNDFMQKSYAGLATSVAAAFSTAAIVRFGKDSIELYRTQAKAISQVEQGLISTGNAVGFTSEELQKQASEFQKNTLFGDEDILQNATAQLLTFTNIADEQFTRTQKAALDLSTRLDGDLKSASIQLGKALNDPVANLSALSRSGIQFTKEQKALIKSLVETNQLAEAQTIILDELEKQYGGSAEAAALADGGITQLGNAIGDTQEVLGKLALEGLQPVINELKEFFENLSEEEIREFLSTVKDGAQILAIITTGVVAWKLSMIATNKILKINRLLTLNNIKAQKLAAITGKQVSTANLLMAKSFKSLKIAFAANPIGLLVTGLSVAIPLISSVTGEADELNKTLSVTDQIRKDNNESMAQEIAELDALFLQLRKTNKGSSERNNIIGTINDKYGTTLQNLKDEESFLTQIDKAYESIVNGIKKKIALQTQEAVLVELIKKENFSRSDLARTLKEITKLEEDQFKGSESFSIQRLKFLKEQAAASQKTVDELKQQQNDLIKSTTDTISKLGQINNKPTVDGGVTRGSGVDEVSYYKLLNQALKDAQQGLINLSGKASEVDAVRIQQQQSIISNIQSQIEEQERLLGISKQQTTEKKEIKAAEKGSIAFLEKRISLLQADFKLTSSPKIRASITDEINLYEEELKVIKGISSERTVQLKNETLTIRALLQKRARLIDEKVQVEELSVEYNKLNKAQLDTEQKIRELSSQWLSNLGGALGSISSSISTINEDLGKTLQEISEVINSIGTVAQGLASGNYLQALTGAVDLATKVIDKLNDRTTSNERVLSLIETQNKELEQQVKLLEASRGIEIYSGLRVAIKSVDNAISETNKQMLELNSTVDAVSESGGIAEIAALAEQNAAGGIEDITEALKNLQTQQDELLAQRASILDKYYQEFTGTTSDAIADSIIQGFKEGKTGIDDFAGTFEETMQKAIIQSFNLKYLQSQFDQFYEEFGRAAESGGGVSASELQQLRTLFNANIEVAGEGFAELNKLYEETFGKGINDSETTPEINVEQAEIQDVPVSTAGQIRASITEETGSILAGRIGAIVLSNEKILNSNFDMLDYAVRGLQYQKQIAENTNYLPQIEENTRQISEKL